GTQEAGRGWRPLRPFGPVARPAPPRPGPVAGVDSGWLPATMRASCRSQGWSSQHFRSSHRQEVHLAVVGLHGAAWGAATAGRWWRATKHLVALRWVAPVADEGGHERAPPLLEGSRVAARELRPQHRGCAVDGLRRNPGALRELSSFSRSELQVRRAGDSPRMSGFRGRPARVII